MKPCLSWIAMAMIVALAAGCNQATPEPSTKTDALEASGAGPRAGHPPVSERNLVSGTDKKLPAKGRFEPGIVLVKFKPDVTERNVTDMAEQLGLSRIQERSRLGVERLALATRETVPAAVERLNRDPLVIYAEPNYEIRRVNVPNDTRYGELWGMHNTGQTGGTPDADIDAEEAWDISIGSYNVIVAVLDTGVDYNHPDLADNMWTNPGEIPGNGIDDDGNGYIDDVRGWNFENETNDPADWYGHGTHCAGTIGAVGNNSVGVAGVNWRVTIMPLMIIGNQDLPTYCLDAAEGIQYAVDNGAHVMSCSWWTVQEYSQTLEDTVAYSEQQGVFLVAAAGNDSRDDDDPNYHHWPSEWPYENIIAVAATNHTDNMAYFSNFGPISVDVGAPGEDILSTTMGGGYGTMSGTSMATPHTAGVVALMLSLNPSLTVSEAKNILFTTVDPIPDLQGITVTGGRINAHRALQVLAGTPLPPVALAGGNQTVTTGSTVGLDGSASFDPNQDPLTFDWDFYPPPHSAATLSDETSATPTFFADVCGDFQASLTVNDGTFDSDPDTANVYVRNMNGTLIETPHPYGDDMDQTWTITHPGAVVMSVHFASFDTERGWDFVYILDGNDTEVAIYDGVLGEFSTVSVQGDTVKIRFTSDGSVTRDGFVIDAYYWCDASNCAPGTGDCDGDPANGCETDTSNDLGNCGWCGHLCAFSHASATCESAICQIGTCDTGWTDCDGDAQTGCEADLLVDPANCGGCGSACGPYPNATAGCAGGSCTIESCDPGWDDCDGLIANGCERDVSSDINNCGACGNVCNLDHATSHVCVDGVCHPGDCTVDPESISTPHDYPNDYDDSWTITKPGADEISVHFVDFDLEYNMSCGWDWVRLYDGQDNLVVEYCGTLGTFWSDPVPGDTVRIDFHTDVSVTAYGFDIDSVRHCTSGCEGGWGNCDADPSNGCESNLNTDVDNCGGCGQQCGGDNTNSQCIGGTCFSTTECLPGFGDCDGDDTNGCETDLDADPDNCGTCGTVCAYDNAGALCDQGSCMMGACDPGWGDCDVDDSNGCEMDLLSDTNNCGSCGNVCDLAHVGDHVCDTGVCYPGDCANTPYPVSSPHPYPNSYDNTWTITHPGADRLRVHFSAFDTETGYDYVYILNGADTVVADYNGAMGAFNSAWVQGDTIKIRLVSDSIVDGYGFDIDTYEHCTSGCDAGWADCDGLPDSGCESHIADDPGNCGTCGNACDYPHAYGVCTAGSCSMGACHSGWADCDGDESNGCEIYIETDVHNCGGCGMVCDLPQADPACVNGGCIVAACHPGYDDCDGNHANGCEVELGTDVNNCGSCGNVCAFDHAGASCQAGGCVLGACDALWDNCDGQAANGCETSLETLTDCGACGTTCARAHATADCSGGACHIASCDSLWDDCDAQDANGCEASLETLTDCGACGVICDLPNATDTCSGGSCQIASCEANWDDCDGQAANGCETDTDSDAGNCGGCGTVCAFPNATASCQAGACVMGACDAGYADCDSDSSNGCEVDIGTDVANCGACANACVFDHAAASCEGGSCVMGACDTDFADCDADPANGCEVDTTSDADNCGACDNLCVFDNASATCVDSACEMGACDAGFEDCDADSATGCEADLASDPDNCGACATVCAFDNAEATCVAGTCAMGTCLEGFGDCDADSSNGCEADLTTDAGNCGVCGNVCPIGSECEDGVCGCADADADSYQDVACGGDDCDDTNPEIHPGAEEICDDGIDQDCNGQDLPCDCPDADADGYEDETCGGTDCDDANAEIHPDADDICEDGIDQDCDGEDATCGCEDADADGYEDEACGGDDCDDTNADIHPGAEEECDDGIDQDCNGQDLPCDCPDADADGHADATCGGTDCDDDDAEVHPDAQEVCEDGIDNDCDGEDASCCAEDADSDGYYGVDCGGDDCDDTNADIHPGAEEICGDEIDQDCDGQDLSCDCTDEDGDGFKDADCGGEDCDDADASVHPGAQETCGDDIDQNCDGEDMPCDCPDDDGDTFHAVSCGGSDCDDTDAAVHPGAEEICGDGTDQDCDGTDLTCEDDDSGCGCASSAPRSGFLLLALLGLAARRRRG